MKPSFFERYANLILTFSGAIIAFSTVFLVLFYVILPNYRPALDEDSIVMPPLANGQNPPASELLNPGSDLGSLIGISILITIALIALGGFSVYGHMRHKKLERDDQRRQDLDTLRQGFETYKTIHGRYPMSSTYQPEYYTGINLSKDWNYYGLPNADQMRTIIKEWPLSDPSIDYHGSNQANQYLYYPRNEGRSFDLYAHLELPKPEEQKDYNSLDNLLRSWGAYNYKVSSSGQSSAPVEALAQASRPLSPEEMVMQQSIVEQTIPADSQQVNAELNFLADEVVADAKPQLPEPITNSPAVQMPNTTADQLGALNQAVAAKQAYHQPGELPVQDILPGDNQQ